MIARILRHVVPIVFGVAAFVAGWLAVLAVLAVKEPGSPEIRVCPRDPDTYRASERFDGLSLSLGSRFELCDAPTWPFGVDVTARVPPGGYLSLLLARRGDEELWFRGSRSSSLPTAFLILARSRPPRTIPAGEIPVLPEDLRIEIRAVDQAVSAAIVDPARAERLDRRSRWRASTTLEGVWEPLLGVGAGAPGVVVRSIEVLGRSIQGTPRTSSIEFGGNFHFFTRLGAGAAAALMAWVAVVWWWSRERIRRLSSAGDSTGRQCPVDPSRRNAFAQLVVVFLLLLATTRLPAMVAIAGCSVLGTMAGWLRAALPARRPPRVRRRSKVVAWLIGSAGLAFGLDWFIAPRGDQPVRVEPVASWQTPSLATVWELPYPDRVDADVDLVLDRGQAVWFTWSGDHPESQGRPGFNAEFSRSRPGLLVRRQDDGILLVGINSALPVTAAQIPLAAALGSGLRVHIAQHGEHVSVGVGAGSSLRWKALPPAHPYLSCLPLTNLGAEPRLTYRATHDFWPSLPAALRLFAPRLLVLMLGMSWFEGRLRARGGAVTSTLARSLERLRKVLTGLTAGAFVATATQQSDIAAVFVNLAATAWIVGGCWLSLAVMFAARFRPHVVALGLLFCVFVGPLSLPIAGPMARAYAYAWWRLLPPDLTWAFHPTFGKAAIRGNLRFADRDHAPAWSQAAKRRWVTLGGSQTRGLFYDRQSSLAKDAIWPRLLEQRHPQLEVVNLGLSGKSSTDMTKLAIGSFPLVAGQVYVGVWGCNDGVFLNVAVASAPEYRLRPASPADPLYVGPSLWPMLEAVGRITAWMLPLGGPTEGNQRILHDNILELDGFLRAHGSRLLLVYEPLLCEVVDCEGDLRVWNGITPWRGRDAFLAWTAGHDILALDPIPGLRSWRDAFLFTDSIHFTLDGHAVMASLIDDAVGRLMPEALPPSLENTAALRRQETSAMVVAATAQPTAQSGLSTLGSSTDASKSRAISGN